MLLGLFIYFEEITQPLKVPALHCPFFTMAYLPFGKY